MVEYGGIGLYDSFGILGDESKPFVSVWGTIRGNGAIPITHPEHPGISLLLGPQIGDIPQGSASYHCSYDEFVSIHIEGVPDSEAVKRLNDAYHDGRVVAVQGRFDTEIRGGRCLGTIIAERVDIKDFVDDGRLCVAA